MRSGETHPISNQLVIGRVEGDLVLENNKYISGKHCKIEIKGTDVYLVDLGAKNPVILNKKQLNKNESREITIKDIFFIGKEQYQISQNVKAQNSTVVLKLSDLKEELADESFLGLIKQFLSFEYPKKFRVILDKYLPFLILTLVLLEEVDSNISLTGNLSIVFFWIAVFISLFFVQYLVSKRVVDHFTQNAFIATIVRLSLSLVTFLTIVVISIIFKPKSLEIQKENADIKASCIDKKSIKGCYIKLSVITYKKNYKSIPHISRSFNIINKKLNSFDNNFFENNKNAINSASNRLKSKDLKQFRKIVREIYKKYEVKHGISQRAKK